MHRFQDLNITFNITSWLCMYRCTESINFKQINLFFNEIVNTYMCKCNKQYIYLYIFDEDHNPNQLSHFRLLFI